MTNHERQRECLILVALGKVFTEQSTYLIGELKQQTKMDFNNSVNAVNTFVKGIERMLTKEDNEFLEVLTDAMNDGLFDLRKTLDGKVESETIEQ
jgi:hypothetical protein